MEFNTVEFAEIVDAAQRNEADLRAIADLELVLVGGGVGVATFG